MKNYNVSPDFKTQVSAILATKKFTTVFPYMNLINRDGFTYTEGELNSFVQHLGEYSYNEVAEFFQKLPGYCTEQIAEAVAKPAKETTVAKKA